MIKLKLRRNQVQISAENPVKKAMTKTEIPT